MRRDIKDRLRDLISQLDDQPSIFGDALARIEELEAEPDWRSTYGAWWGVWHTEDEEFVLLEADSDYECRQLIADMAPDSDHLQIRQVSGVRADVLDPT